MRGQGMVVLCKHSRNKSTGEAVCAVSVMSKLLFVWPGM